MTGIEQLYEAFVAEYRAGGAADPRDYLRRVDGAQRERLAERIDAYLDDAPPPPWDPGRYAEMAASPSVHALVNRARDELTDLLDMANQAELLPGEVAERLATSLGVSEHRGAVRLRYHELQSGLVSPDRVAGRVWDALAAIFGTTRDRVRAAAERAAEAASGEGDPVFARLAAPAPAMSPPEAATGPEFQEPGLDAVDAVFFAGD